MEPHERLGIGLVPAARFDEHRDGAAGLDRVAERPRLELVVVARDHALGERPHGVDEAGGELLGAAHVRRGRGGCVGGGREHGHGRRPGRRADTPACILVVQIEAEFGLERFDGPSQCATFRRGQPQGIAVDVDALRIEAARALGAVGIQERNNRERAIREYVAGERLGRRPQ